MKNIHIFAPPFDEKSSAKLPMVWAMLKTYYEHRGKYPTAFNWVEPELWLEDKTANELVDDMADNPPDVLGFSGYVWNIKLCYEVCRLVRERWPNCLIVAGGPQPEYKSAQSWWADHSYIDIVVPTDGEVPFTAILDRVAENKKNFDMVPDVVLPNKNMTGYRRSLTSVPVKDFTWPASPLLEQSEVLARYVQAYKAAGREVHLIIETNRGCPYQCTFCDWGGGTYTKVRLKPMEMVLAEVDWVVDHQVESLHYVDANFGMFPRDPEIAEYIANKAIEFQFPKKMHCSPAKQNKDRVTQILKTFRRADLHREVQIYVQDLNHSVLKYIKRIDVPWEQNIEHIHALREANINPYLVTIMGLPGWTKETFLDDVNEICTRNLNYPKVFPFLLLPNAPAAEPKYMQEHQIKTISRLMEYWPVAAKPDSNDILKGTGAKMALNRRYSVADFVIESKWFSVQDLLDCKFISGVVFLGESAGITKYIARWLVNNKNISYREFYLDLAENFFKDPTAAGTIWSKIAQQYQQHYQRWVKDETTLFEIESPTNPAFPFLLHPEMYWAFHGIAWLDELVDHLLPYLVNRYGRDPELEPVVKFNQFLMLTPGYNANHGRKYVSEYNFIGYLDSNEVKKEQVTIIANDQVFHSPYQTVALDWHNEPNEDAKLLAYFYRVAYGVKSPRYLKELTIQS